MLLFYIGTAPARIQETYATENLDAARGFLDHGSLRGLQPWSAGRLVYPRHGVTEAALFVPFVLAARLIRSGDPAAEEWLVSLVPSLFTALLIVVLHQWCRDLGASRRRALAISLTAALGTMLWPYTALGLEPVMSASAFAAGYSIFAFGHRGGRAWPLAAGVASAIAAGTKETGLLALPALFLLFAETWRARPDRKPLAWLAFGIPIAASLCVFAMTRREGVEALLGTSLNSSAADGGWQVLFGMWGQLASPNKGIVFYSPAVILALAAWPDLNRRAAPVARWVLVLAVSTIAGMGTRSFWAEETWGPRYDHVLIAPLLLSLAAADVRPGLLRFWKAAWVLAAALGGYVAVVGLLFWYGHLFGVMERARASELSRIQYDPTWNPIEFHSRLLAYRLGLADATFRPRRQWWYATSVRESIYIGDYARFEPLILNDRGVPLRGGRVVPGARWAHLLAFVASLVLSWRVVGTRATRDPASAARGPSG